MINSYGIESTIYRYLTVNATVLGSIPTRENELFSFIPTGKTKRGGVDFLHSTRNVSKIEECIGYAVV